MAVAYMGKLVLGRARRWFSVRPDRRISPPTRRGARV
jgi:hypothetical protein